MKKAAAPAARLTPKSIMLEFPKHVAAIESDSGAAHPLGFDVKMTTAGRSNFCVRCYMSCKASAPPLCSPAAYPPGADIAAMSEAGVPALGVLQDGRTYFNYHHTAADTLDKVVPGELRENAAAMAVMGYALASMKDPLPR